MGRRLLLYVILMLWWAASGAAEKGVTELSLEELLTMSTFVPYSGFTVSPDNRFVAYNVARTSRQQAGTVEKSAEIWVTELETKRSFRVCCTGGMSALAPSWSPDGQKLAFSRGKSPFESRPDVAEAFAGRATLAVWDKTTGKIADWMEGRLSGTFIYFPVLWINDRQALVLSRPESVSPSRASAIGKKEVEQAEQDHGDSPADPTIHVTATRELSNKEPSTGTDKFETSYIAALRCNLTLLDLTEGRTRTILTDVYPTDWSMSPDHGTLAFAKIKSLVTNSFYASTDIEVLDARTFARKTLVRDSSLYAGAYRSFSWSADGRYLSFPFEEKSTALERKVGFVVVDIHSGLVRRIPAPGREPSNDQRRNSTWSPSGHLLMAIRGNRLQIWDLDSAKTLATISIPDKEMLNIVTTESGLGGVLSQRSHSLIVRVRDNGTKKFGFWDVQLESGHTHQIAEGQGGCSDDRDRTQLLFDESLLFCSEWADQAPDLYRETRDFARVDRLTHLNPALDRVTMGQAKIISWKGVAGKELKGALLLPSNYQPGNLYPLVVYVYPVGDTPSEINNFGVRDPPLNLQLLATRGYAVLVPGVTTTPKTFMKDIADSITPGVEEVIRQGLADPEKIGVFGHSAGGYAVLALLVQSPIFHAGVMSAGSGDLIALHSSDYSRRVIEESWGFGATPWENPQLYLDNSPYLSLDKLRVPLLILQGARDRAVPAEFAREVFGGLKRLGKKALYVEYEDEDHNPSDFTYSHQLDYARRLIGWFDEYLKGDGKSTSMAHTAGVSSGSPVVVAAPH